MKCITIKEQNPKLERIESAEILHFMNYDLTTHMYVIEDTEGDLTAHEHVVAVEDVEFCIGVGVGSTVAHCHLGDLRSV